MSDDPHRLWLQDALNQTAIKRTSDAIAQLGSALPCRVVAVSGSIVTVAFEVQLPQALPQIMIPKAEGPWIRSPTQVGDLGMTVPADVYLGGVSGLGGGIADGAGRANLTSLVWVPIASTKFPAVNINAAFVSGPAGAVIQDTAGTNIVTLDDNGTVTITSKTKIVLNAPEIDLNGLVSQGSYGGSAGTVTLIGPVNVINDVTAGVGGRNISQINHVHSGIQSGASNTAAPVSNT